MKLRAAFLLTALLVLTPTSAKSDIAFVRAADLGNNGGTTNSLTVSYSAASGSSVLYIVVLGDALGGADDVSFNGTSYGGVTAVRQLSDASGTTNRFKSIFAVLSPPSGANNIVINALSTHYILAGVAEYKNSVQQGSPDSVGFNDGFSPVTSVTGSITTVAANTWILAMGEQGGGSTGWTAGAGATFRTQDAAFAGATWAIFDSNGPVNPGSHSMTVTVGAAPVGQLILDMVSFAPAGGGSLMLMGCCY